jgi:hypothetical protein
MMIDEWATERVPKDNLAKFHAFSIGKNEFSVPINNYRTAFPHDTSKIDLMWPA